MDDLKRGKEVNWFPSRFSFLYSSNGIKAFKDRQKQLVLDIIHLYRNKMLCNMYVMFFVNTCVKQLWHNASATYKTPKNINQRCIINVCVGFLVNWDKLTE